MKTLREQFEEDYGAVAVIDSRGRKRIKYVYDGDWYRWMLPAKTLKKQKSAIFILSAASLILTLFAGSLPAAGNQSPWTAVPALCSLAIQVLELVRTVQFLFAGNRADRTDFAWINGTLRLVPVLRGCLLAAAGTAALWTGLAYKLTADDLLAAGSYWMGALTASGLWKLYRSIPWEIEKKLDEVQKEMGDKS